MGTLFPSKESQKELQSLATFRRKEASQGFLLKVGVGHSTPKIAALLRKRPVLLRANFVLAKDQKRPYYGHFCGKKHREGSRSKAAGGS